MVERVLYGKRREVPEAAGRGDMQDRTRWLVIRDGLRACIETMPQTERGAVSQLQEVWAYMDSRLDRYRESGGEWKSMF